MPIESNELNFETMLSEWKGFVGFLEFWGSFDLKKEFYRYFVIWRIISLLHILEKIKKLVFIMELYLIFKELIPKLPRFRLGTCPHVTNKETKTSGRPEVFYE